MPHWRVLRGERIAHVFGEAWLRSRPPGGNEPAPGRAPRLERRTAARGGGRL
jgi:hypothetical protein